MNAMSETIHYLPGKEPHPREHRLIFRNVDREGWDPSIECYLRDGGYEMLKKAVDDGAGGDHRRGEEERPARPRRRGFPDRREVGLHSAKSSKPIYLICNADESEPGTFKDRYIIHQDPHQLIEGMMISCFADNVKLAYIYIRGEFPHGARILEKAIAEARAKNFLGKNILGTGYELRNLRPPRRRRLHLRRGDRADRIARRQAPLSADQAAVFSRGARALHVPDDREQRGDALPREAHRRDGRRGVREDRHAEQHRHAHPLRQRRRAEARLLRIRSRQDHDGRTAQRGVRRADARPEIQGGDSRRLVREDPEIRRDVQAEEQGRHPRARRSRTSRWTSTRSRRAARWPAPAASS